MSKAFLKEAILMYTRHHCETCGLDHDTKPEALACEADCLTKEPKPVYMPRQIITISDEFSSIETHIIIRRVFWQFGKIEYDVDNADAPAGNPLPEAYLQKMEVKK